LLPKFTSKVKALIGGPKGCNHLLALLTAMAPAAVQGAFSAKAREPIDQETSTLIALKRLKDTCWAWREAGPLVENTRTSSRLNEQHNIYMIPWFDPNSYPILLCQPNRKMC
jgi:hypothetical protein